MWCAVKALLIPKKVLTSGTECNGITTECYLPNFDVEPVQWGGDGVEREGSFVGTHRETKQQTAFREMGYSYGNGVPHLFTSQYYLSGGKYHVSDIGEQGHTYLTGHINQYQIDALVEAIQKDFSDGHEHHRRRGAISGAPDELFTRHKINFNNIVSLKRQIGQIADTFGISLSK